MAIQSAAIYSCDRSVSVQTWQHTPKVGNGLTEIGNPKAGLRIRAINIHVLDIGRSGSPNTIGKRHPALGSETQSPAAPRDLIGHNSKLSVQEPSQQRICQYLGSLDQALGALLEFLRPLCRLVLDLPALNIGSGPCGISRRCPITLDAKVFLLVRVCKCVNLYNETRWLTKYDTIVEPWDLAIHLVVGFPDAGLCRL